MYTDNSKIILRDVSKEMKTSFLDYSMSVIVSRALPDVRDGLKPVHRRILYTMWEAGLLPDQKPLKCAATVGDVLGKYHPHGDASVYDALVRMAQTFSLRYPLVDGHGNFGSVDGDAPAAYRYTEAKMSKISLEMLTDINKETIPYTTNYDDRLKEPVVLPSRFPNLLVNGSTGIAVGMATNIPPHNLTEVIDGIRLIIENPDATLDELMARVKGPDFPTGGIIMGRSGIRAAYGTGKGKITLRARSTVEEIDGRNCIIVDEIPYQTNKAELIKAIAEQVKNRKIDGIHFVRDESDKGGMRIVIELKHNANTQIVLKKLYSYTEMQKTVAANMLALCGGVPRVLTLRQILDEYHKHQIDIIVNRSRFEMRKLREREIILQGLVIAADNLDEVIEICRSSAGKDEIKRRLCERFFLQEVQAEAIANMRMYQLSGMERQKILDELQQIQERISYLEELLASRDKINGVILEELAEIQRKYGDNRRTDIEDVDGEVDIEELIPVREDVVTFTNIGYIKRMDADEYKIQKRGGKGVAGMKQREEDAVTEMFTASTHDNLLFITSFGLMYKLKCYEIPEGSKGSRGTNIINIFPLSADEKISAIINTGDFQQGKFLCMVTKNGIIKRTDLSLYKNCRKGGLRAIDLREGDELAGVSLTDGSAELIIVTHMGMSIRIAEQSIRALSRTAYGVRAIKLYEGDYVVCSAIVKEDAALLTVTDRGYGRRTATDKYRIQARGGYGTRNYKVSPEKGYVCGAMFVTGEEDIILISTGGVVIRIRSGDIAESGRYAAGVRVMRLTGDAKVVTFTDTEHDDEAEIAEVDAPNPEDLTENEPDDPQENEPENLSETEQA
ncbi:MAG: DNA gyrase subunit A [Oscillospiraceae bacterium]|jgi:DNA gyrase subunit A|nr:DNA gyrase subunit A [Oscillospiraceae bacterium]